MFQVISFSTKYSFCIIVEKIKVKLIIIKNYNYSCSYTIFKSNLDDNDSQLLLNTNFL